MKSVAFLFSRYEAHYAVPLGRKKTSKAVKYCYLHVATQSVFLDSN